MINAISEGKYVVSEFVLKQLVVLDNENTPCKNLYEQIKHSKGESMTYLTIVVKGGKKEIKINPEIMYLKLLAVKSREKSYHLFDF